MLLEPIFLFQRLFQFLEIIPKDLPKVYWMSFVYVQKLFLEAFPLILNDKLIEWAYLPLSAIHLILAIHLI